MNSQIINILLTIIGCLTPGWADWRLQWNEEFVGKEINKTRWIIENEEINCPGDY